MYYYKFTLKFRNFKLQSSTYMENYIYMYIYISSFFPKYSFANWPDYPVVLLPYQCWSPNVFHLNKAWKQTNENKVEYVLLSLKSSSGPNLEEKHFHLAIESDAASQLGLVIFPGGAEVRVSHLEPVEPSAIHQSQFKDINLHQYLGRPQMNGSCLKESRCPSIALEI